MKIKNIFLSVVLLVCGIGATAQDVTVLHMKNGTTKRYTNGVKGSTHIDFYEHTSGKTFSPDYTTTHENGYSVDWGVNYVTRLHDEYVIGLFWEDNVPVNFQAKHGVCFGTKAGLTVDNCEQKMYATDARVKVGSSTGNLSQVTNDQTHYMWIGPWIEKDMTMYLDHVTLVTTDSLENHIKTPLEKGQTYYYRMFAEGQVIEGGQQKTVVFYDDERSFRVPHVMDDFDYYSYPCATEEALNAFVAAHLPDSITAPTWQQLEPLWNKWRATDEGKNIDLSADITTEEFDDGTGYRLNRIPDEFYTWIANREVVIDPFDVAEISKVYNSAVGDSSLTAMPDYVTNIDTKWDVPGGKYVRFTPVFATMNHSFTYKSNEVIPGVRYKLCLNFAPETEIENTDSTASMFLPTKIRVYFIEGGQKNKIDLPTDVKNSTEVSATEVTSIEVDFSTTAMGLNLRYETDVSSNNIRKGTYNRILRIAEAKLIPIKDE